MRLRNSGNFKTHSMTSRGRCRVCRWSWRGSTRRTRLSSRTSRTRSTGTTRTRRRSGRSSTRSTTYTSYAGSSRSRGASSRAPRTSPRSARRPRTSSHSLSRGSRPHPRSSKTSRPCWIRQGSTMTGTRHTMKGYSIRPQPWAGPDRNKTWAISHRSESYPERGLADRIKGGMACLADRLASQGKTRKHSLAQLMLTGERPFWMLLKVLSQVLIDRCVIVGHYNYKFNNYYSELLFI